MCIATFSLLDGLSKPTQIAERCVKLGYKACALTDHGTMSGTIQFIKACNDSCTCGHQKGLHNTGKKCVIKGCNCEQFVKSGIRPILGEEFYLSQKDATIKEKDNRKLSHLVVLSKNLAGWKGLIQATSEAHHPDNMWYKKPRLQLQKLSSFAAGNWIVFSGHPGSDLANLCFTDYGAAYKAKTYEEARTFVRPDWKKVLTAKIREYQELFGKENFYLEIQLIDGKNIPAAEVVARILRYLAKQLNIKCVSTPDAHYPTKQDAQDQRVTLCAQFETTLKWVEQKIAAGEDPTLAGFFKSNNYHIPCLEEMVALHTEDELQSTVEIAERCETYDVLGKPILPNFDCPNGLSNNEYLKELCLQGWKKKIVPNKDLDLQVYKDRAKHELDVIFEAGLPGYFLIVQDYVQYAKHKNHIVGCARGSAAGSLIAYLLDITTVDPIENGLIFERFYNAGRNTKDRVSLPDIDCDFSKEGREDVFQYVSNKYGLNKVAHMVTFGRMQGKAALKDVLRANNTCSHTEMNQICKCIPNDAAISDDLQKMKEEEGESSIIRWALENNADQLSQWCRINEEGKLEGDLAIRFEQAIRLEGTKRNASTHASGVVITPCPLADICPIMYDKNTGSPIAAMEMGDLEAMGLVKLDILGVSLLSKLKGVENLLRYGRISA